MQHIYGRCGGGESPGDDESHPPARSGISEGQAEQLRQLFEEHGMERGYIDVMVSRMGGGLSKSRVRQQLKAWDLKRGVLTARQVTLNP